MAPKLRLPANLRPVDCSIHGGDAKEMIPAGASLQEHFS